GRLAVAGTVNDLAMVGAQPAWLTAAFIMEEGFDMHQLADVLTSMSQTAAEAGIRIVAGDTKVAEKGKADGLFINTTGLGLIPAGRRVSGANAQVGDAVLVSGTMGDHGIAVLAARGGLDFEAQVVSDVAPVNGVVEALFGAGIDVHVLRDPTRGGLATTLNEIAKQSQVGIVLEEGTIPVRGPVAAACEMLGFDPLYVANEGKLTAIVPQEQAEAALEAMRATRYGKDAACIGTVEEAPEGRVLMKTAIGGTRMVDVLAGEILPRIC
ncbi:MAG: hydrogenase expression/formation protein HypE, partial [Anaerolineales bacterium]